MLSQERRTNFIGRIQEQRQFRVALGGLLEHHRRWRDLSNQLGADFDPDQAPVDESYTRIFLPHGIGGIGKSWLVDRCLTLARAADYDPTVLTLYEDVSLGAPVLEPAHLVERIQKQLLQAGYETEIPPDRQIQAGAARIADRVTRYRLENRERWQALVQTAARLVVSDEPQAIQAGKTGPDRQAGDAASLAKANELLLERMQQEGQLTPDEAHLVRNPQAAQAAHLVSGLEQIVRQRPLVIALDNLEILVPLEPFIRDCLVMPTIHLPIFWILSGRHNLADERVVQIDGQKQVHKGYRDLLGENPPLVWDMSAFGDADLHEYLEVEAKRRRLALTIDDNLIAAVKATSSGIPLVVEMAADALFTLDRAEFLQNFVLDDQTLLPASRLEQVTARFLRYCLSREDDLERVQGLALLRKGTDERAIRAVWALPRPQGVADMLLQMGTRYAFVQADGLHDAVYGFVRRQLHTLKKHSRVREKLSRRAVDYFQAQWEPVHDTGADPALRTCASDWQEATRDLLNARLWADPDQAAPFFLLRFIEGLGFDRLLADELLLQVEEFLSGDAAAVSRAHTNLISDLRAGLKDMAWFFDGPSEAIGQMVKGLLKTPGLASLHLSILHLWRGSWLIGEQRYDDALVAYFSAEQHLPAAAANLREQLGKAFYQLSGHFLWPERASETASSESGLQAARRATALNPENGDGWYNLGLALEALERAEEALPAYRRAIEIEPRPVHYNSLGDACSVLGRYDEATDAYQQALELDPVYAWPYHGLGLIHSERGQYEQAVTLYQQALERHEHDRDRAASWDGLGDLYSALGRYDEAIDAYQQGIKLNPNDALLWYGLGNVYRMRERNDEAIEAYRRALELDPTYAWSYHKLGRVYEQRADYSRAMIFYQQALERHKDDAARAVSWNSLGDVHSALGREGEAIAAYQRAIELDPGYAAPWKSLGEVYSVQGRHDEAVDAYRQSIKLYSDDALAWYNLGNAFSALDRYDEAIGAYRQAIELDPDNAWPYNNLGFVYQKLGQPAPAVTLYQQAIERHENDRAKAVSWDNLGNAYRALSDHEQAGSAFRWAGALDPDYAWPYHNLGLVYVEQGKYEPAVALFQQALEHHTNDRHRAVSWNKLGDVYHLLGRPEEAITAYRRVIELNPTDARPWYSLGNIYRTLERPNEVIEAYRRAIELDPTYPWPYHNLGLIYAERRQYEAAITCYRQAIERHENDPDRAVTWTRLGDVYRALDRLDRASGAYRQAIELNPAYAWPYHNLALIYSEHKDPGRITAYESAISFYRQAIERHENDRDRAQAWRKLGHAYRVLNRFAESIEAYGQAIELDPQQAPRRAWNDLGDVYRTLNRLDRASEAYQRAIEADPVYAWPYHNLGLIYERQAEYEAAITFYQQAIERHENDLDRARAWNNLGDNCQAVDRSEEAIEAYRRAIELDPNYARPRNSLGRVYHALDRSEEAIEAYRQAIELEPANAPLWNSLGDIYRAGERFEEAGDAYRQAVELDPAYAWPYHGLALIYEQQGRYEASLLFYRQAIERHKQKQDQAVAWNHLGDVYLALERYDDGLEAYRQAIVLDPTYAWPYHNLALFDQKRGEYEAAIPRYQQAIERHRHDRDRVASWKNLGDVYRALDRPQEAIEAYQQTIELDPNGARPWNSIGTAYTTLQHYGAAIEAFERAVDLDPTYAWPYHNLGFVYEKREAHETAIPFYQQAIERHQDDRDSAVSWNNLGNIYRALERHKEAIKAYRQATRLDPTYALPWDSLGDLYRTLDRREKGSYAAKAIEAYRRAIELDPAYAWPYHNLGLVYRDQNEHQAAIPFFQQAIERHQNNQDRAVSWNNLGNVYSALGRSEAGSKQALRSQGSKPSLRSQAIDAHRRAIALDPAYAWPYNNLAFVYAEQGAYEPAVTLYQQAIERHRNDENKAVSWDNLGNIFAALGRFEEAIEAYRQAIALDPDKALPWYNLGNVHRGQERYEAAIDAYRQAIELDPTYARPWNSLGDVYRTLERPNRAIEAYQRAIELDPAYAWPYGNLAPIYESRGEYEQAIIYYQQAIERHQSNERRAVLWHRVGNVHRTLGQHQVVINAYQQAIELDPTYALPWYNLGNLYAALERYQAALEAYGRAIELAPNEAWAYHNLGLVHEKLDAYETAAGLYRQAIELHRTRRDRAVSWYHLGNVYSKQWHYKEAVEAYRQAIKHDAAFALPWSSLGDVFSALRDQKQAIRAYRRAIELDPAYAPPYNNLGFVYEQLGQYKQAMALYQQVIERSQDRQDQAVSWNNLGNIYRTMERPEKAIEAYRQAIELDPDYTWPYHNLGAIYEKRGQNEQALALYQRATRRYKSQVSP